MAATLGFEHHVLDFRSTFRQHVMDNFVREYTCGRTPDPCVMGNSHIKWGELIKAEVREIALNHGFEKLSKGVAPGQSLVVYKDGLLVGGGIIEKV